MQRRKPQLSDEVGWLFIGSLQEDGRAKLKKILYSSSLDILDWGPHGLREGENIQGTMLKIVLYE